MDQQQFQRQCMRLFWPAGLFDYLTAQASIHILVGICFHAKHVQCGDMIIAAVLGASKLDHNQQTLQQLLLQNGTKHPTASSKPFIASPTVVGSWANTAADAASVTAPEQHELWLSLHGKQQLQEGMHIGGCGRRTTHLFAPEISWQRSQIPPGIRHVQVFLYELPAPQYSSSVHAPHLEQLQQQHQQQQPGWMLREPGAISLASILHMLQQVHGNIQQQQQLILQGSSSHGTSGPMHTLQQQQQQVSHPQGYHVADLLSWPNTSRQYSKAKQLPGNLQKGGLQCWRPRFNRLRLRTDEANISANAACSASRGGSSATVLPGLLQHLLGVAAAWLLLRHQQELLLHAAAAGAWLQRDALQPHIEWLMQARPGGIKLHQELSLLLGSAASAALNLAAAFYTATWPYLGPAALFALAAVAAIGGAVAACFAAADMLLLLAWPLEVVYGAVAVLHRVQLKSLAATWRLIRGKQKVRRFSERWRQREQQQAAARAAASTPPPSATTSTTATAAAAAAAVPPPADAQSSSASDEVSVEQLIVGVLLFTPLLGLFPTTAAWYLSVCCCHGLLLLLRLALLGLGLMLRLEAVYLLVSRWTAPQRFQGQLMVQLLQQQQQRQHQRWPVGGSSSGDGNVGREPGSHAACTDAASTTTAVGAADCDMQGVAVSYYHVFNSPLGYAEMLWQFWARKRVAGDYGEHTWGKSLLGLVTAIITGKWWGLALHCS